MPAQILNTKLSIPPMRSKLVMRQRLTERLNQGLECGFILVSAPAGYGKSTLLSAWLPSLNYPTAWLSLDDIDNDPSRFLSYLLATLRVIDPSIEEIFKGNLSYQSQPEIDTLLTQLVNRLSNSNTPFCLVLDDYHLIQNQIIHGAVSFLLEHHPPSLHMVIATRADPPLPLARLRVRSDMLEIRMADLRFTSIEAADFLNHTMGLNISPADVERLTARTEGWVAGLQMAALSMHNTDDISGFISTLSGSHHYIFDYLLEEILTKQAEEIRRFLLSTSILNQLTAPLCDAILAGEAGCEPTRPASIILDELMHANLFIIPLDLEQRWYRYHPLFAELLRGYLHQSNADEIPALHARASAWFEGQGLISEAIRHSFAANDWERVIRLISANIFALLEQNELNSVARQLDYLMHEPNPARPWLLVARAWLAAYTGQLSTVEPILKQAGGEIDGLKSEAELQNLGGHIAAIRAYIYWIAYKRDIATSAARAALEWLPESEYLLRCQAATLLGLAFDDFTGRNQAFKQALEYAHKCSVSHVTIFAHGCWAWYLSRQGRLREAHSACLEAIRLASNNHYHQALPSLSHVYSTLSSVLCEWNDLESAVRYSKEAVSLARHWEQADALHFALDNLGYALFACGDVNGAFEVAHQAWQVACSTSTWFEEITLSQEVDWYLESDNIEAALQCYKRANIDIELSSRLPLETQKSLWITFSITKVYISQKRYSKALPLTEALAEEMESKGYIHSLISALAWQALAYQGLKQDRQALASISRALTLGEPEGYFRTFIHMGPQLIPLLRQARADRIVPDYVDSLLEVLERRPVVGSNKPCEPSRLVEALSVREMDVLRLLAQGCPDKKIAETLVIARETVHKHLKNIYGKLNVHSRSEAIARARELELL